MLTALLLAGRLALCGVLAIAAVGKLLDLEGSQSAVAGFGLPARVARPIGTLLPFAELALVAALLPAVTVRWSATAAGAMFAAFGLAAARSLARGETPDCHCFGRFGSSRVSGTTLGRTLVLAAVAAAVAAFAWEGRSPSAFDWVGGLQGMAAAGLVLGVAAAAQALVAWQLLAQNGRLVERVQALEGPAAGAVEPHGASGLVIGEPAPAFESEDLGGVRRTLDDLLGAGAPVALVFVDPGCSACDGVLPLLEHARAERAGSLEVVLVSRGAVAENRAKFGGAHLDVLLQRGRELIDDYRIPSAPSAIVVDERGLIASPVVRGARAIEELLAAPRLRMAG